MLYVRGYVGWEGGQCKFVDKGGTVSSKGNYVVFKMLLVHISDQVLSGKFCSVVLVGFQGISCDYNWLLLLLV
jgi:hypothetical protein